MANPQKENGHTDIANELYDAIIRTRIPGEASQVFHFILRKTYGYNKLWDRIPLSQFVAATGIRRPNICRTITKLESMNMIRIIKKDNRGINKYSIIKNYEEWKPLSKKIMLSKKIIGGLKKDNGYYQKRDTQKPIPKTNISKDTTGGEKEVIKKDNEYPSDFEIFWITYPNHKSGKMNAYKSWGKINPCDELFEAIIGGLSKAKKSNDWMKDGGRYVPMATTWLNQGRWDAEYLDKSKVEVVDLDKPKGCRICGSTRSRVGGSGLCVQCYSSPGVRSDDEILKKIGFNGFGKGVE